MMKKINSIIGIFLVMTIFLMNFVFAFGVASSYWEGKPAIVYQGETTTLNVRLQNMVGGNDVMVKAELTTGQEIAKLKQTEFIVKAGTKDTQVPIEVTIPENTATGTTHPLSLTFRTISTSTKGGGVAMGTGMVTGFNVLVTGRAPEEVKSVIPTWIIITSIAIVIIIIIIILLKRRTKKIQ